MLLEVENSILSEKLQREILDNEKVERKLTLMNSKMKSLLSQIQKPINTINPFHTKKAISPVTTR